MSQALFEGLNQRATEPVLVKGNTTPSELSD